LRMRLNYQSWAAASNLTDCSTAAALISIELLPIAIQTTVYKP
jgi:hypothetical protein